jgi:hypothetical protein
VGCVLNKFHLSQFIYQCNFSTFQPQMFVPYRKTQFPVTYRSPSSELFQNTHFFLHIKTYLFIAVKGYWTSPTTPPPEEQNSVKVFTERELSLKIKFILMVWWTNPRLSGQLSFVQWRLTLARTEHETCFMSPLGYLKYIGNSRIFGKSVEPCINVSLSMYVSTVPLFSVSPPTLKVMTEESPVSWV